MVRTQSTEESLIVSYSGSVAMRALRWQAVVVAAYRHAERTTIDRLGCELASRIRELTGQSIEANSISVDAGTRTATGMVDDVVFQVRHGQVVVVRPCVQCGVGRFASPVIDCAADLGYALAGWEPRCAGCPLDDADWSYSF